MFANNSRFEIERWGWPYRVCLVETHRLICNMTFSGKVMTLTWGQIFNLTFQGQIIVHSTRLGDRNTILAIEMSWPFEIESYCRKTLFVKTAIFEVFVLWRLNCWPEVNFDNDLIKRRVQKLSIAFPSVFLAIIVPEIMACFLKNIMTIRKFWPLMTSGDPNIALRWKMTKNTLKRTHWELSTAFYRVFLALLVFELDVGGNICPPPY